MTICKLNKMYIFFPPGFFRSKIMRLIPSFLLMRIKYFPKHSINEKVQSWQVADFLVFACRL